MQRKDVEACTAFMTINCNGAPVLLDRKVITDCARPVPHEGLSVRKPSLREEVVKEIVESALERVSTHHSKYKDHTLRTGAGRKSDGIILSP